MQCQTPDGVAVHRLNRRERAAGAVFRAHRRREVAVIRELDRLELFVAAILNVDVDVRRHAAAGIRAGPDGVDAIACRRAR